MFNPRKRSDLYLRRAFSESRSSSPRSPHIDKWVHSVIPIAFGKGEKKNVVNMRRASRRQDSPHFRDIHSKSQASCSDKNVCIDEPRIRDRGDHVTCLFVLCEGENSVFAFDGRAPLEATELTTRTADAKRQFSFLARKRKFCVLFDASALWQHYRIRKVDCGDHVTFSRGAATPRARCHALEFASFGTATVSSMEDQNVDSRPQR